MSGQRQVQEQLLKGSGASQPCQASADQTEQNAGGEKQEMWVCFVWQKFRCPESWGDEVKGHLGSLSSD